MPPTAQAIGEDHQGDWSGGQGGWSYWWILVVLGVYSVDLSLVLELDLLDLGFELIVFLLDGFIFHFQPFHCHAFFSTWTVRCGGVGIDWLRIIWSWLLHHCWRRYYSGHLRVNSEVRL